MSRIDEALRRAAGERVPAPATDQPVRTADAKPAEQYPSESRPRAVTRPEAAGVVNRPASRPVVTAPASWSAPRHAPKPGRKLDPAIEAKLVGGHASPLFMEQYRKLAAALHEHQVEHGLKILMVTSALPQEGKTLTAVNLALTFSESYARRVLLVDADLRRPSIHSLLEVANTAGLNDALGSSRADLPITELSPLLGVMTAGRHTENPLAGLASERMREVLDECASRYDWVLLDAPPVGLLPDAQLLARLIGAVVLVIRAESTPFALVEKAVADLGRECIVGTVLNGVDDDVIPAGYYADQYR